MFKQKLQLPTVEQAIADNPQAIGAEQAHLIFQRALNSISDHEQSIIFGMGCFWGVERLFWQLAGVTNTAVGYAGGITANPTYEQVCSGLTGHTEVVQVHFDPQRITLAQLLNAFWHNHDPSQGMRQGNDQGTPYRSAIYCNAQQLAQVEQSKQDFSQKIITIGHPPITTEIKQQQIFYFAEDDHQQYLHKHPDGYCNLRGITF